MWESCEFARVKSPPDHAELSGFNPNGEQFDSSAGCAFRGFLSVHKEFPHWDQGIRYYSQLKRYR